MVKKYLIFDCFDFLRHFFRVVFYNNFFGRTKFTRSSLDKTVLKNAEIPNLYLSPILLPKMCHLYASEVLSEHSRYFSLIHYSHRVISIPLIQTICCCT